jgi:hypothetical protein
MMGFARAIARLSIVITLVAWGAGTVSAQEQSKAVPQPMIGMDAPCIQGGCFYLTPDTVDASVAPYLMLFRRSSLEGYCSSIFSSSSIACRGGISTARLRNLLMATSSSSE